MLCDLAVQVIDDGSHVLRISGKTAQGPSGTGGSDRKSYASAEELLSALETMGLNSETMTAAARVLATAEIRHRFLKFAENAQIPFETLEKMGIDLFD